MKIDDLVEPRVREAFAGIVKQDSARFDAALRELDETGSAQAGVELATAVVAVVVTEMYGGRPDQAQVRELSETVAQMESWQQPEAAQVESFITAVLKGRPLAEALPAGDAVVLAFLVAASLLAARARAVEGRWWFNYLDEVEAVIEAK